MSTFSKIKDWFRVVEPNKKYLCGLFFSAFVLACIPIVQALPSANVITSLTTMDYVGATIWLLVDLALIFIYYLTYHINYKFYYKLCQKNTLILSNKIYDKIYLSTEESTSNYSLSKILLTMSVNIENCLKFSDYLTSQSCYILQSIFSTIIVSFYNIYIALIMALILFILYFWYAFLGKKTNFYTLKVNNAKQQLGETLFEVIEGRDFFNYFALNSFTKEKYMSHIGNLNVAYNRRGVVAAIRQNWTYIFLYAATTSLTIWLASMTKFNALPVNVYLVISPYLSAIISQAASGYELINHLEITHVSVLRIQSLLQMPTNDIASFANNTQDNLISSLVFSNVTFDSKKLDTNNSDTLLETNIELPPRSISLFCGDSQCGKDALFYILRRTARPSTGTVTMDGINIFDFDSQTYKHNFSYVTSTPNFYNESILDNLKQSGKSASKCKEICKKMGVHKNIIKLKRGYDTNLVQEANSLDEFLLFAISLARSILCGSEWIAIYDFPPSLTEDQQEHIKNILLNFRNNHAFILFSSNYNFADICDNVFVVESGNVRKKKKVGPQK